jgi:O-antigen/teichoic acid export membrane protein
VKGLARLSSLSVGLKIVRFLLGMASSVLLTRLMSIEQYGIYAYALVVAALLAIPGEAGMPNLAMREIARARVDDDLSRVRGMAVFASLTVLAFTLAMAVIAVLLLWVAGDRVSPVLRMALLLVLPAVLFGALANTRAGVQRALGGPLSSQVPEQLVRPAALIGVTLLIWLIAGDRFGAIDGVISYVVASAIAFAVGVMLLRRSWRENVGAGPACYHIRAWLVALVPFSAIAGLQVALVQVSAFVLGLTSHADEMATFRIATLASDFVFFSTFAIHALVAPQFAKYLHRGEIAALQVLVGRVNRLNVAFASAVTAGLLLLGPGVLALVFGEPYRGAYVPMCVLAAGHLGAAVMGYAPALANMAGRERMTLAASAFGLALSASLSILLCPRYGSTGAAIAAAATAIAWRLTLSWRLHRTLGLRPWAVSRDLDGLRTRLGLLRSSVALDRTER